MTINVSKYLLKLLKIANHIVQEALCKLDKNIHIFFLRFEDTIFSLCGSS